MKVFCHCVGDKYPRVYIDRLYNGIVRNTRHEIEFECITEARFSPAWWNRLLLFPPKERIVNFDLDVVITGNIDFIFDYDGQFCIWQDPWGEKYNGSVWSAAPGFGAHIRETFLKDPALAMAVFYSDQEFLTAHAPGADIWPRDGKIKSYKASALAAGPGDASVVVFHGDPKPHTFESGWVKEQWV